MFKCVDNIQCNHLSQPTVQSIYCCTTSTNISSFILPGDFLSDGAEWWNKGVKFQCSADLWGDLIWNWRLFGSLLQSKVFIDFVMFKHGWMYGWTDRGIRQTHEGTDRRTDRRTSVLCKSVQMSYWHWLNLSVELFLLQFGFRSEHLFHCGNTWQTTDEVTLKSKYVKTLSKPKVDGKK